MADSDRRRRVSAGGVEAVTRKTFLTGFALTIPVFVALFAVGFVVDSLSNILDPVVVFTFELTGSRLRAGETPAVLLKLVAIAMLLVTVFSMAFVAERRSGQSRIEGVFDATVRRIPGRGSSGRPATRRW